MPGCAGGKGGYIGPLDLRLVWLQGTPTCLRGGRGYKIGGLSDPKKAANYRLRLLSWMRSGATRPTRPDLRGPAYAARPDLQDR